MEPKVIAQEAPLSRSVRSALRALLACEEWLNGLTIILDFDETLVHYCDQAEPDLVPDGVAVFSMVDGDGDIEIDAVRPLMLQVVAVLRSMGATLEAVTTGSTQHASCVRRIFPHIRRAVSAREFPQQNLSHPVKTPGMLELNDEVDYVIVDDREDVWPPAIRETKIVSTPPFVIPTSELICVEQHEQFVATERLRSACILQSVVLRHLARPAADATHLKEAVLKLDSLKTQLSRELYSLPQSSPSSTPNA